MNSPEQYTSYLEKLESFESDEQEHAVMFAHLRGLQGQLETLKMWEDDKSPDKPTRLYYRKFYDKTFGSPEHKSEFESLQKDLSELLINEAEIDRTKYDTIYKKWEILSKHIGS